jgi:hypothetical protein
MKLQLTIKSILYVKIKSFKTNWINLVFEYKNKGYGAYQLSRKRKNFLIFAFHGYLIMYCPWVFPGL